MKGNTGIARGESLKISNYYIHKGEERCISGIGGSGTVILARCNLKCCFCNIFRFSQQRLGYEVNYQELSDILILFQEHGCQNINLSNINEYVEEVIEAIRKAKSKGLQIPIILNSSGYEPDGFLELLEGLVDVYLVDCKYGLNRLGLSYSGVHSYREVFLSTLQKMYKQVGKIQADTVGLISQGIVVRHLILPNNLTNSLKAIELIKSLEFSDDLWLSILSQYVPEYKAWEFKELSQRVTSEEYYKVYQYAQANGLSLVK